MLNGVDISVSQEKEGALQVTLAERDLMHGISCHLFGRSKGEESESRSKGSLRQEPSLQSIAGVQWRCYCSYWSGGPVAVQLCRPETTLMLMLLPLGKGAEKKIKTVQNKFLPSSSFQSLLSTSHWHRTQPEGSWPVSLGNVVAGFFPHALGTKEVIGGAGTK